jgi:predicted  nucleic acid-binding Zn-ribbon protein
VMENAKRLSGAGAMRVRQTAESPFGIEEIRKHLEHAAALLSEKQAEVYDELALSLRTLAGETELHVKDLEDLERRLTALEEKLVAVARTRMSDDLLLSIRRQLDAELSPYRGKMTADQISMLERRYLDTRVLQEAGLPRLSLFYLAQ